MNCSSITPLHCALAETAHTLSQCRLLIDIMNRLGLCISYDTMKRVDSGIAKDIIQSTFPDRCPVSKLINVVDIINGAIDNLDFAD